MPWWPRRAGSGFGRLEEQIEGANGHHGDPDREREGTPRVLGLSPRLSDRVESDEAREEDRGGRQEARPTERGRHGIGDRHAFAREKPGGEVALVEQEACDDHDPAQYEHQEH